MTVLKDDEWFLILKYSSLNDRTKFRRVCKKWSLMADKISVKKLIIFYNLSSSAGHLKLTGEKFSLGDTVQVTDWDQFIRNEFVQNNLKSVEKLAIISTEVKKVNFHDLILNKLVHLELTNIRIDNESKLLESSKIESLYFMDGSVNYVDYDREFMEKNLGFLKNLSRSNLRQLSIKNILSLDFLKDFGEMFAKLQVLDIHVKDVTCICYINDEFENLRNLNAYVFDHLGTLDPFLTPQIFEILKISIRTDLKVSLFDMSLELDPKFMCDYLEYFRNQVEFDKSKFIYYINEYSSVLFKNSIQKFNPPNVLFKNIDELIFQVPIFNIKIFKQMVNVESIVFTFKKNRSSCLKFEKYLKIFKNLKKLELIFEDIAEANHADANKIIRLLPVYCSNVHTLKIKSLNNNNLKFKPLGIFKGLKFLALEIRDRISTKLYKKIIRNNKHLVLFEVLYVRKRSNDKEAIREQKEAKELKRMKESVQRYGLEVRMIAKDRLCLARSVRWCLETRAANVAMLRKRID